MFDSRSRMMIRLAVGRVLIAVVIALVFGTSINSASAATRTWTGAVNTDWYNSGNWSPVGPLLETDDIEVYSGTITGSQSPVIRDGGSIYMSGSGVSVSFPALWFLNIAKSGTGTVTVRDGAHLTSLNATFIGDDAGSNGELYVDGLGSSVTLNDLLVGVNGLGYMEVSNGASVTSDKGVIGLNSGAVGSRVLVTGTGSIWDMGDDYISMQADDSVLDIEAGGTVLNHDANIGWGGHGTVNVTGTGSTWTNTGTLDVGKYGAGTLNITDGGAVSALEMGAHALTFLGYPTSDVTVTGVGSRLDIAQNANIAKGMSITNTGPSTMTIGFGATVDIGGTLDVFNQGWVFVNDGGTLKVGTLDIDQGGFFAMSGSTVHANQIIGITGFNGYTGFEGDFTLGHNGTIGSHTVSANQTFEVNNGLFTLGGDAGSAGQFTVQTMGEVNAQAMLVGGGGSGQLLVDGGVLNITGDRSLDQIMEVGGDSPSTVTIQNGGVVNVNQIRVGIDLTAAGSSVLVTGAGSELNGLIHVGTFSQASLRVENGASLSGSALITGTSADDPLADDSSVEIDGATTTADLSGPVYTFYNTQLTVSNGASFKGTGIVGLGGHTTVTGAGSTLDATLDDGSTTPSGISRGSTITVKDGAQVMTEGIYIGDYNGQGHILVTGPGSSWTSSLDIVGVGGVLGDGSLEVANGANFSSSEDVFVTISNGGSGELLLHDSETRMDITGNLYVSGGENDGNTYDFTSAGTVVVGQDAILSVSGTIAPYTNGTVELSGGYVRTSNFDLSSGGEFNFTAGVLSVDQFIGDLDQAGGTLSPGSSAGTAGITQLTGNFQNTGTARYDVDLGGIDPGTGYDQLLISGTADVADDGVLFVSLIDSFIPTIGDMFTVLTADGGLAGRYDEVYLPELPDGIGFDLAYAANALQLHVGLAGDLNGDGFVGLDDLDIILGRWNQAVDAGVWMQGDPTGDGFVGLDDLDVILGNWNKQVDVLAGDLDGDGYVGLDDLDIVLSHWNQSVAPGNGTGDPTGDGFVGLDDLDIVLGSWNEGTPPPAELIAMIPEPASVALLVIGLQAFSLRRLSRVPRA